MKKLFTFCFLVIPLLTNAQSAGKIAFQYDQRPTVTTNTRTLLNPWAGGLNAPQYSTIRLNNDTRDDLVVFDRTTNKISTFIAITNPTGTGVSWQYAPEYESAFPVTIYSWLLLVDYDADGRKDIFTNGPTGVSVFHNESQGGQVIFKLAVSPLITEGLSGFRFSLFINSSDIPAITDYDDDGDIDVITFDADGNIPAYHQNMSVERTGKPGGLDFKRMGDLCWGHFRKEFCNDFTFGFQCDGSGRVGASVNPNQGNSGARPQHTGNALTVVDTDGDGKKDLLFGFVSCENIARLRNGGPNSDKANFVSYDSLFPARNPILFPAFPATFWEDVDGDGQKDLLASPNVSTNENQAFDFRASGWFYKNTGTTQKPDLQLVQKDFLQNDMLDLGDRASPALADLDGDGDQDLLIGYGVSGPSRNYRAGIWQFENTGTNQNPAFTLITTDYLNLSKSLTLSNIVPAFADADGNGSLDLILAGTNEIQIWVLYNAAAKGAPVRYTGTGATRWPTPDRMEVGELPTVTDVDRDGKPDLLIGKSTKNIHYFRNTGTTALPVFQLQSQTFGGLPVSQDYRTEPTSLVVVDVNGDQRNELVAAQTDGNVRVYRFPDQPDQPLVLLDSLAAIGLPGRGLVATAADLDGDQLPDLMLGSTAGGVRYLKNTSQKVVTAVEEEPVSPWVFPNPTNRYLTIRPQQAGLVEVVSLSGKRVLPAQTVRAGADTILDLVDLPAGTYIVRLLADTFPVQARKIVVWK